MNKTLDEYYRILGVGSMATTHDLKRAYREKAKLLHPDRNPSADAHEQFILLSEAYECLINIKSGNSKQTSPYSYAEWQVKQREHARERAREYARMRYEEYIKTEDYRANVAINTISDHLKFFFGIALIIVIPIVLIVVKGLKWGVILSLVVLFVTLPITVYAIRDTPPLNFRRFRESIYYVLSSAPFLFILLTLVNIAIIGFVGFQTLIPLLYLFLLYVGAVVLTYAFTRWVGAMVFGFRQALYSFCLAPLFLGMLFTANYVFSDQPKPEVYAFTIELQQVSRGYQESSLIVLEGNAYSEHVGIRIFFNYEKLHGKKQITYWMANGLFRVRVMKGYVLN